ncbi:MAG: hypothetical protein LBT91_02700 [Bifidobacteriaceae bacterium]|jgi:hypothetical protein|nr:hypothetical protein [Bifidobacteriaceae bacterium]
MNISKTIYNKIRPLLNSKCDISQTTQGVFDKVYENIPCRLDNSGTPTINPDGTNKTTYTTHNLYIPKKINGQEIDPRLVQRVWINKGSIEDKSRDLMVRKLVSGSDSGVLCFYCEAGKLRNLPV